MILMSLGTGACAGSQVEPEKSHKRVDLGKDLLSQGQDAAAETEFKKAIVFDPANEEAHMALGLVYLIRAHRNVRLLEKDDCLQGTVAQGLRDEANEQMRTAEHHFARATELAPDYGEAWQNRAQVAAYFLDWDNVLAHAQKALANLARLQKEELSLQWLGRAWFEKREHPKAATALLQALQRDPDFCLGAYRLAEVLFETKDYESTLARLQPFLEDPKRCPIQEAHLLAGQTYLRLHEPEAASKYFESCVESFTDQKSCAARSCRQARAQIP
jgi:type IV pilus assembly protein PilF